MSDSPVFNAVSAGINVFGALTNAGVQEGAEKAFGEHFVERALNPEIPGLPPLPSPPSPDNSADVRNQMEAEASRTRAVRGRASTILTSQRSLGDANTFRRSLLGY